jgi:hypothetical protein
LSTHQTFSSGVLQLCAALDAVLLVNAGLACSRSYLKLSCRSSGVDLCSVPCKSQAIALQRCSSCASASLAASAVEALTAASCLSDVSRAASTSIVTVMECFSIFNQSFTVRLQEQRSSSSGDKILLGINDRVLSDHAVNAIRLQACAFCHFPLVAPHRRLRSHCILHVKIW